jgi:hypothetical protein
MMGKVSSAATTIQDLKIKMKEDAEQTIDRGSRL